MSDSPQSITPSSKLSPQIPSWLQLYLNVHRESGIERITKAVAEAEAAIFQRWQELQDQPGNAQERTELQEASDELLKIKTGKLKWPDIEPKSSEGS